MVGLVLLLDPAQDRQAFLGSRFVDVDRLEPAGEGGVFLDVLAVLVERRRADTVQLTPGQRGLEHVGGVHGAVGLSRADQRVQLIDEQDDAAACGFDVLEHGLEPFFELTPVLRSGDQRAQIQHQQALAGQALRHVVVDDAQGEALGDGGLAHAGLADHHRVVLGPAREHLHRAADFFLAADDGIEATGPGFLGQVAGELLQRFEAVLGCGTVGGLALAHGIDRRGHLRGIRPGVAEGLARRCILVLDQGLQQPVRGHELVASSLGKLLRSGDYGAHVLVQEQLLRAPARDLRHGIKVGEQRLAHGVRVDLRDVEQSGDQPGLVVEQAQAQVRAGDKLVIVFGGEALRSLQNAARTLGEA